LRFTLLLSEAAVVVLRVTTLVLVLAAVALAGETEFQ
jgi:hypothetical protein